MSQTIISTPSEFSSLHEIEYYRFEEDFVEANMRCIPMIVRFKMDLALIKLKLSQWSKFTTTERIKLALLPCEAADDISAYANFLQGLILKHTGEKGSPLAEGENGWRQVSIVPAAVKQQLNERAFHLSVSRWRSLTNLQRFALIKLSRQGHENKNLCKAAIEFGISPQHAEY